MTRRQGVAVAVVEGRKNLEMQRRRRLWNVKIDVLRDVNIEPAAAKHLVLPCDLGVGVARNPWHAIT